VNHSSLIADRGSLIPGSLQPPIKGSEDRDARLTIQESGIQRSAINDSTIQRFNDSAIQRLAISDSSIKRSTIQRSTIHDE
jgi:hypothetical protein